MRKLTLTILFCLLIVPTLTLAQDSVLLWDLSQVVDISALGIRLNAPDGWVVAQTGTSTYVAETEADLAAFESNQPLTGYVIAVTAFAMEALTAMPQDATLTDILDVMVESGSVELSEVGEVTVNLRPALYGVGISSGQATILTIWKQDDNLIVMGLVIPGGVVDSDSAFSWGNILSLVRPLTSDEIEVAEERYEVEGLGFSLFYPDGWTVLPAETGVSFFELETDAENPAVTPSGVAVVIAQGPLEDAALTEESTLEDLKTMLMEGFGFPDPIDEGDFIVNGYTGVSVSGLQARRDQAAFIIVTLNTAGGYLTAYALSAPDEETLAEYAPVFLSMLWSIQPIE